jgi:hypothetical protein
MFYLHAGVRAGVPGRGVSGVKEILKNPPDWLEQSYLAGYLAGTISSRTLTWAVTAALGYSPYEWNERLQPEVEAVITELYGNRETVVVWA